MTDSKNSGQFTRFFSPSQVNAIAPSAVPEMIDQRTVEITKRWLYELVEHGQNQCRETRQEENARIALASARLLSNRFDECRRIFQNGRLFKDVLNTTIRLSRHAIFRCLKRYGTNAVVGDEMWQSTLSMYETIPEKPPFEVTLTIRHDDPHAIPIALAVDVCQNMRKSHEVAQCRSSGKRLVELPIMWLWPKRRRYWRSLGW